MRNNTVKYILALIILYGVFLRGLALGYQSFWIDEGFSSIVSYFASNHSFIPLLETGKYYITYYLHTFFQSLSFLLFGYSDFSARLPSFIFGSISIFVFYFLAKKLFTGYKYSGIGMLISLFLYTFSTAEIAWSRDARFYELLNLLTLLITYFGFLFTESKKVIYFIAFLLLTLIGTLFHPFLAVFFLIGGMLLMYEGIIQVINPPTPLKKGDKKEMLLLIISYVCSIFFYLMASYYIKKLSQGQDLNWTFLYTPETTIELQKGYVKYYLSSLWENLGIIFIAFLGGILYLSHSLQIKKLILFGGVFLFSFYAITSEGYLAHTRYIFHIYSLIILVGVYALFLIGSSIYEKYRKHYFYAFITIIVSLILLTFQISLFPYSHYYFDESSPKPDFKGAYEYIKENDNLKIISGFPHICVWYNLDKKEVCEYGIQINLTGNPKDIERVKSIKNERYTNIPYITNLNEINKDNYYFVFDDLTIKNAINKNIINEIIESCSLVYTDKGNGEGHNSIGVWKCN